LPTAHNGVDINDATLKLGVHPLFISLDFGDGKEVVQESLELLAYQVFFFGMPDSIFIKPLTEVIDSPFADIELPQVALAQGIGYLVLSGS